MPRKPKPADIRSLEVVAAFRRVGYDIQGIDHKWDTYIDIMVDMCKRLNELEGLTK